MGNDSEQTARTASASGGSLPADGARQANQAKEVRDNFFVGYIVDVYSNRYACRVAMPEPKGKMLDCVWLSKALSYWSGMKDFGVPAAVGTSVLVYVPEHQENMGFIVGCFPMMDGNDPQPSIAMGSGISSYQKLSGQDATTGGAGGLPSASCGMPDDAMPGDGGWINEFGCMMGVLRTMSAIRASDLAKVEAYVMDDLLNIVGHNLNVFSALGECRVRNDHGRISLEFLAAGTQAESMGAPDGSDRAPLGQEKAVDRDGKFETSNPPVNDAARGSQGPLGNLSDADCAVGRWRLKAFMGALGDFFQLFLCSPNKHFGTLATPDQYPDTGLFQAQLDTSGQMVIRNMAGMGFYKSASPIPVPKKQHELDDPAGDKEITQEEKKAFEFDAENAMGASCQVRDYFAYLFNKFGNQRMKDQPKDYVIPEAADAPAPGQQPGPPVLGGFAFQNIRMTDKIGDTNTPGSGPVNFRRGDTWIMILPDGSVSIRDKWASSIEMRGGHIIISAAKDIQFVAGRNIVQMAGQDVDVRARDSIDLTTSEHDIRLKAQQAVQIHSEKNGILINSNGSAGKVDYGSEDGRGEKFKLPGIVIKSKDQNVYIDAKKMNINVETSFKLDGRTAGAFPRTFFHTRSVLIWGEANTGLILKNHSDYVQLTQGRIKNSQHITCEGRITAAKNILTKESFLGEGSVRVANRCSAGGGLFTLGTCTAANRHNAQPQGPYEAPQVGEITPLASSASTFFDQSIWDEQQKPLELTDLDKLTFSFRTQDEYSSKDGKWYETFWQREVSGLVSWEEHEIDGRYPYPGKEAFSGTSWIKYTEENVNTQTGMPKERDVLKETGGEFEPTSMNEFKVHP
jgi:hypothetical protein